MKKCLPFLILLFFSLSLRAETAECKAVPSLLPVWENKDCSSTILGYIKTGTRLICPVDKETWVKVPVNGGEQEGWTFKYGGVLYPWDPEYDTAYYDGIMFENIRSTGAPPVLKEYYRRQAGIDFPVNTSNSPGFDEEMANLSNRDLLKALGPEAQKAVKIRVGGIHFNLSKWLFWAMAILLALCSFYAYTDRYIYKSRKGFLLLITAVVELAYYWSSKNDPYWFMGSANNWIGNAGIFMTAALLLLGQLILFRSLNDDRISDGTITEKESKKYYFWFLGAVLVGIGSFVHHHTFFWWIGYVGVPVLLVLLAVRMLFDYFWDSRMHGLLYIISGLGFSLIGGCLLKGVLIILLGYFILGGLATEGSRSGSSSSKEEDDDHPCCGNCGEYNNGKCSFRAYMKENSSGYDEHVYPYNHCGNWHHR